MLPSDVMLNVARQLRPEDIFSLSYILVKKISLLAKFQATTQQKITPSNEWQCSSSKVFKKNEIDLHSLTIHPRS
jgi:hypothetical protein